MTMRANTHRREPSFDVRDMVLVRLQPYRQFSVTQGRHHKLCKRYYGPYPILERISKVAYRVGLLDGSRIHPVFHICILKLFRGKVVFQTHDLPTKNSNSKPVYFPMALCATQTVFSHGVPLRHF